ncbi:MAG: SDR family oxidoreductase [Acidimicrobiia bacterium]|nr:SDR family oxidoreductase [Acidimicrobiia bacterium]
MDINNRAAIVTGGARRVGKAIALALAGAGARVFIHYNSSAGPAEETLDEIEAAGGTGAIGAVDLGNPELAPQLIDMATDAVGEVSILVNSASGFATDSLDDVSIEGWRRSHDLTLVSPVFLTQAFAAALGDGADGAVVNVTDVRTMTPYQEHFSYVIAKGGVDAFTRAAALALAPRIRVNAVALGVILPPPGEDAAYVEALAEQLPLQRVGGTDPVAAAALHLIRNDFITGEIIRLDGGGHLV